jgi:type IV fimbrial biogenesis protein FimT
MTMMPIPLPAEELRRNRRVAGFTILELMISITIGVIVAAIAVPSFSTLLANSRLTASANDLLASLQAARGEAIKRNGPVVLCGVTDSTVALPQCVTSGATTWVVFQDVNGDGQLQSGEPIIELHPNLVSAVTLRADGNGSITFLATGFPNTAAPSLQHAVFCDRRGVKAGQLAGPAGPAAASGASTGRAVVVSTTGHARVFGDQTNVSSALAAIGTTCP